MPIRRAELTCALRGCGLFETRESFLLHVMDCPHVFPGVRKAAKQEYDDPKPMVPSSKGAPVHPDFFEPYDTSTLPKKIKGARGRPATF